MTNQRPAVFIIALVAVAGIVLLTMLVVAADRVWQFVGALVVIGATLIVLALIGVKLFGQVARAKNDLNKSRYDFLRGMAEKNLLPSDGSFIPIRQLALSEPQAQPQPAAQVDPRHDLLVRLTLLTLRSPDSKYGPLANRLMSANDAQAAPGGVFADRMQWDAASKYGQECGYLMVQRGGPPDKQGLLIHNGTASDLIEALMSRNLVLDSAVTALPLGAAR